MVVMTDEVMRHARARAHGRMHGLMAGVAHTYYPEQLEAAGDHSILHHVVHTGS